MLPQCHRLSRRDFQLIYSAQPLKPSRVTHANGQLLKLKLIAYVSSSSLLPADLKIGIILSKKVVKHASKRNYLKRQLRGILREALRSGLALRQPSELSPLSIPPPSVPRGDRYFLVITFLPFQQQPSFSQLQQETLKLLSQVQLI
ncbi:MAG: ribonuclease P protein component [Pseudanabaenaceae cyanobacterium bins.68]|nr:ribonuclease P protein component [Pseudanabaenaceae cyanobacterium bins.68]